jgi:filamentous hemagglutinin
LSGLRATHSDLLSSGAWSSNAAGETSQARGRPVVNDLLGRVTSLDGWNHTYSCDGLLLSSEPSAPAEGSRRSVHAYDALGRRVRTMVEAYVGGQWVAFSSTERDFLGRLPLGIETSFADGSLKSWRFLRGPDASGTLEGAGGARGVLAVLKDASSWKAVAADTLGNVLALAGVNGDFTRRTFDPWGNPLVRDTSGSLRAATLNERRADYDALPLAWASQEIDPDTGLTHYHFREYSPSLGGWLTRDPIGLAGGYLNLRSYLGNRPADELDVWGEEALTVTAALGALAAPAFGGALVAVTVQGAVDLYNGERSSDEVYYSVAAGGAAAGVVGRFTGNAFAIGAAYGGTSNLTKQLLDEKRQSIHWDEVADDAAFGAVLGKVGEKLAPFAIAGVRRAGAMLPSEIAAQISAQLSKLESSLANVFAKRQAVGQGTKSPCPEVITISAKGADDVLNAVRLRNQLVSKEIAGGHAFEKHAAEFGFKSQSEMAAHIENVMAKPTAVRNLSRGRTAYWDDATQSIVIRNPSAADGGTAFKPIEGRAYFETLK